MAHLWHQKFVTADVTAVFVNNQHGIQRRGQDFDKNFICNQYRERLAILNTENIKICWWITKLEVIKMQADPAGVRRLWHNLPPEEEFGSSCRASMAECKVWEWPDVDENISESCRQCHRHIHIKYNFLTPGCSGAQSWAPDRPNVKK